MKVGYDHMARATLVRELVDAAEGVLDGLA